MQATNFWCGWWDLNPHASQRHPLKMVCLPFHHNRLYKILSKKKASFLLVTRRNGAEDRNRTGTDITIRGILSPVRLPVPPPRHIKLEATPRFELGNKGFADLCLTTWLCRRLERKTRLELATLTLARWCSTTELLPHCLVALVSVSATLIIIY